VTAHETFLPGKHGQTAARIAIFQGESEYSNENAKLGEVTLKGLRVIDRANTPIDVSFELSTDGTLSVNATDTTTGASEALRIEARTELGPSEVDRLAREQAKYAAKRSKEDESEAIDNFKKLLDRGEKFALVLEKSAEENPSADATAAVGVVKSLLDLGRVALQARSVERMAEISKRLALLMRSR
jgi:molecular chaperone DnaK